jgi:hypothetical protein
MCFSPTASFVTAGLTGAVGVLALSRTTRMREAPLAAFPLFFAGQQAIEGALWLNLPAAPDGAVASGLALAFLVLAEVFWPVYAPAAAWLAEPEPGRRRTMAPLIALGLGVGGYFAWRLAVGDHTPVIERSCIVYKTHEDHPILVGSAYLAAAAGPLLLSSRRTVSGLGAILFLGSLVAFVAYRAAFLSVWCFFAAAASLVILFHVETLRRRNEQHAAA